MLPEVPQLELAWYLTVCNLVQDTGILGPDPTRRVVGEID